MSKDYIKTGSKFYTTVGAGNFARKFRADTMYGSERHLADNVDAVVSGVKKYEKYIRRGGLGRMQRLGAYQHICKQDKNLTVTDKKAIKKLLSEFKPQEKKTEEKKTSASGAPILTPAQVMARRNQVFASRVESKTDRPGYAISKYTDIEKMRPGLALGSAVKKFALNGANKAVSGLARRVNLRANDPSTKQTAQGLNVASSMHSNPFSRSGPSTFIR